MINGARRAVCVAMFCLAACGGGGSGVISGKVTFSDGSDAKGLPVTLLGPVGKRLDTGAGGTYSFDKLPRGVYQVAVEGADTRERRLSFGTESDGSATVTAPDLAFSPIGTVTGKVMNGAGPALGATVYLGDRVSLTDAMGAYLFSDLAAGDYSIVAKASGPFPQQASTMLKVVRGKNEAMPMTLANDLSVTGKLDGTLALFNGASPKDIKVSVADVSVMTSEAGIFSLTLPPGEYEAFAELAGYPKQSVGIATVRTGQTTTLPLKTLSLYKAFPWPSRIGSASWDAVSESDLAVLRVNVDTDYSSEYYFLDTKTAERRLFAIGFISRTVLSKNGKWVAFSPSSGRGVVAINSMTGQMHSFSAPFVADGPVISSDEATMMFFAGSPQNQLVRVDLNTGAATTFPAFSGSYFQTNERFLARSATTTPFNVQLITQTNSFPATNVFNNMQALVPSFGFSTPLSGSTTAYPVMLAYNCPLGGNCNVQILGPTAASSSQLTTTIPFAPSFISGSVKDWAGLQWSGGRALIKVADATATTLPATTTQLFFNETQSRVVIYSTGGLGYDLREDIVPPNATSTVLFTANGYPDGAWISPTRFMAFGSATNPTKRIDIKNGIPAPADNDVTIDSGAQSPLFFPPGVLWVKASTMKRTGVVYDSPELPPDTLGITSSANFSGVGSRSSVLNSVLGKFAGFSDGASIFALDGVKPEVRKIGVGQMSSNIAPFVPTDRMKIQRLGGFALQFFESGRVSNLSEPGQTFSFSGAASMPKGGTAIVAIKSSEPRNILYLGLIP